MFTPVSADIIISGLDVTKSILRILSSTHQILESGSFSQNKGFMSKAKQPKKNISQWHKSNFQQQQKHALYLEKTLF